MQIGATAEYIEQARQHARAEADLETVEFTLWPDVEVPFRVFQACKWEVVSTLGGAFFSGIPSTEIQAVTSMLGIEVDDTLLGDIRVMEAAASKVLNRKK